MGENRHGNLGTYSGDGEGDNPLLSAGHSKQGLWVRSSDLVVSLRLTDVGMPLRVALQLKA